MKCPRIHPDAVPIRLSSWASFRRHHCASERASLTFLAIHHDL
jgi:hypothetical protein